MPKTHYGSFKTKRSAINQYNLAKAAGKQRTYRINKLPSGNIEIFTKIQENRTKKLGYMSVPPSTLIYWNGKGVGWVIASKRRRLSFR